MKEAPLVEHLEELRTRLFIALGAWAIFSGIAFIYRTDLLRILKYPLDLYASKRGIELSLVVQDITEPFTTALKVATFGGLVLALPVIVSQIWGFIAPGLYAKEKQLAVPFLLGAGFSFALGVSFGYFVLLPFAIPFLLGFLGDVVVPVLSIGKYMSQVLTYMALMGILFEMPVLAFLLSKLGLISSKFLAKNWRVAAVLILVIAAVITPTGDMINLSLVTIPLLLLYALSIGIVKLVERTK